MENTVGKGEIARYEQFLLFPQCFQKACYPGASKGIIVWEWVKLVMILLPVRVTVRVLSLTPRQVKDTQCSKNCTCIDSSLYHKVKFGKFKISSITYLEKIRENQNILDNKK